MSYTFRHHLNRNAGFEKQPREEMMKAWQAILIVGVLISAVIWFRDQAQLIESENVAKCVLENMREVGSDSAAAFIFSACTRLRP